MPLIQLNNLRKAYRVYQKKEGLQASLRGLFKREFKEVEAVRGIDLEVEKLDQASATLGENHVDASDENTNQSSSFWKLTNR